MTISYRMAAAHDIAAARYAGAADDPLVAVTYHDPVRGFTDLFYSQDQIERMPLGRLILRLADLDLRGSK